MNEPRCPTCGSARLHVAIHTTFLMQNGEFIRVSTTGPQENLTEDSWTVCDECSHEGPFWTFRATGMKMTGGSGTDRVEPKTQWIAIVGSFLHGFPDIFGPYESFDAAAKAHPSFEAKIVLLKEPRPISMEQR